MRAEKQLLLDEIKEKIENSKGLLITRYQKLNSDKARSFRELVQKANGEFEVVKKRIFIRALAESRFKLKTEEYEGDIGILFAHSDDVNSLSKLALKYGEENDKAIELVGGVVDGSLLNAEDIMAYAKLPSINELRSQFVGTIACPLQDIVSLFDSLLCSIVYGIDERSKEVEKAQV